MATFEGLDLSQKSKVIEFAKTQGINDINALNALSEADKQMLVDMYLANNVGGTIAQNAPNNNAKTESKQPSLVVGIPTIESFYENAIKAKGRTLRKEGYSTRPLADVKYYLKNIEMLPGGNDFPPYEAGVCVGNVNGVDDIIKIGKRKYSQILANANTVNDVVEKSFIITKTGIDEIWTF